MIKMIRTTTTINAKNDKGELTAYRLFIDEKGAVIAKKESA